VITFVVSVLLAILGRLRTGTSPGVRHRDLRLPEGARRRALSGSHAGGRNNFGNAVALRVLGESAIAWAKQSGVKLGWLTAASACWCPTARCATPLRLGSDMREAKRHDARETGMRFGQMLRRYWPETLLFMAVALPRLSLFALGFLWLWQGGHVWVWVIAAASGRTEIR
jgi:hypothetical protein